MPGGDGGTLGRDRDYCWRGDLRLQLRGALGAGHGPGGLPPGELQGGLTPGPCAGHFFHTVSHHRLQGDNGKAALEKKGGSYIMAVYLGH